jgi:hypothetical protein
MITQRRGTCRAAFGTTGEIAIKRTKQGGMQAGDAEIPKPHLKRSPFSSSFAGLPHATLESASGARLLLCGLPDGGHISRFAICTRSACLGRDSLDLEPL